MVLILWSCFLFVQVSSVFVVVVEEDGVVVAALLEEGTGVDICG